MASISLDLFSSEKLKQVWIAAHWDKKLTKNAILYFNVCDMIDAIIKSENIYSLRISGYLLLGNAKINYKKSTIVYEEILSTLDSLCIGLYSSTNPLIVSGLASISEKAKLTPRIAPYQPIFRITAPAPKIINHSLNKEAEKLINGEENYKDYVKCEIDYLGISDSFLHEIEIAEK